jgi:ubiquitin thioesterase protein OTUB1
MSQATAPLDAPAAAAAAASGPPQPPGSSSPSPPGSTTAAAAKPTDAATADTARSPAPAPEAAAKPSSSFAAEAYAGGNYEAVREAEAKKPYVADKEPWEALAAEYERGAAAFGRKIASLGKRYGALRRTRGDGNCFYRAVAFAHLEWLVQRCSSGGASGGDGAADVARFAAVVRGWRGKLLAAGYQELVFEDALDHLLGLLGLIDGSAAGGGGGGGGGNQQQRLTLSGLVSNFRDDLTSNTLVMLLRMVTSAELLTRAEFFAPFVAGAGGGDDDSVEAFCRRSVEPMGEESDNIQAVALTDAMQLPVRVVYLDSRDDGGGGGGGGAGGSRGEEGGGGGEAAAVAVPTHDFVPEACGEGAKPVVHVLYRPGHYDICYPLLVAPQQR